jgi:hypothetical protein
MNDRMTAEQILKIAASLGWNLEHTATNWMLVDFARAVLIADRMMDETPPPTPKEA